MTEPARDFDTLEDDVDDDLAGDADSNLPWILLFVTAALGVWVGAGVGIGYAIWG